MSNPTCGLCGEPLKESPIEGHDWECVNLDCPRSSGLLDKVPDIFLGRGEEANKEDMMNYYNRMKPIRLGFLKDIIKDMKKDENSEPRKGGDYYQYYKGGYNQALDDLLDKLEEAQND